MLDIADNSLANIESDVTDLIETLFNSFSDVINEDPENDRQVIDKYIKNVTRIGLRIGKNGMSAIQDSCFYFQNLLKRLASRDKSLNFEERLRIEEWPTHILSVISSPDDEFLRETYLDFLLNPIWQGLVTEDEINELKHAFSVICTSKASDFSSADAMKYEYGANISQPLSDTQAHHNDTSWSSFTDINQKLIDELQLEILESISELLISVQENINSNETQQIAEALNLCADRCEILGLSLAEVGFAGLMDVFLYFQSALRDLAAKPEKVDSQIISILEHWPTLVITHLTDNNDLLAIDQIVEYLANIPWCNLVSAEDALTLKALLNPEQIELGAIDIVDDILMLTTSDNAPESQLTDSPESKIDIAESINPTTNDNTKIDELSDFGLELIDLIREELHNSISTLAENISLIFHASMPENIEAYTHYRNFMERIALASDSVGLNGLHELFVHLDQNLEYWQEQSVSPEAGFEHFFNQWPIVICHYLEALHQPAHSENISKLVYSHPWPIPFSYSQEQFISVLLSPTLLAEEEVEPRATIATPEDVSLVLPNDVNQQLLDSLLQELPGQTADFTAAVSRLISGNGEARDLEQAQRIAHTLKGAANTVGVTGIANLTHHIEDILEVFSKQNKLPGKQLINVLIDAADVLEMMSESLLGIGQKPDNAQSVLQQILNWANRIDNEGIPEEDALSVFASTDISMESTKASSEINKSVDTSQAVLRVPAALMDELLRLAGESIILGGQLHEILHRMRVQNSIITQRNSLFQQLVFELEHIVDIQGMNFNQRESRLHEVFDVLELDKYNELHTVTHRLVEVANDARELNLGIEDELHNFDGLLANQSRLHKETQETVMQTRMVPVQNIIPRLQRSVRQTCRFTDKDVLLDVTGIDTLMDGDILNEIVDPIMHIIRNAIDHGIENPERRNTLNKSPQGKISIDFYREGDQIVIRCRDDGKGLDLEAIQTSAMKKNLISDDSLTDDDLMRLIWLPGFSTRNEATQTSGRGIGMDAVYNRITGLKGSVNISSSKDKGCTIELRLPLTLITVHAILIFINQQTYAISSRGISQIHYANDGKLLYDNDQLYYQLGDESYIAYDIETLLHLPVNKTSSNRINHSVLMVKDDKGANFAIAIEKILSTQDLVVKQLGAYVPPIAGIEGATILGDGSIAPVIDLPGLLRTANTDDLFPFMDNLLAENSSTHKPCAFVIDDSLSARRSLAEFVSDLGYDIMEARDGLEAIEMLAQKKPDIILVDLEMPRMNGLEFASHIRASNETREIPIIMVTSRSTEKHRDMAASAGIDVYLTKPFSESDIAEHIHNLTMNNIH